MHSQSHHLRHAAAAAIAMAAAPAWAPAALMEYSDQASFLAAIGTDYYLEGFDDETPGAQPRSLGYGPTNGFTFEVSAANDLYVIEPGGDVALSTNLPADVLRVDFTGASVTALGGYFFATDSSGSPIADTIELSFSDGSTWSYADVGSADFFGFTSDLSLSWVTIDPTSATRCGGPCFPALDDIYVGTASEPAAAPVPATMLLLALGLLLIGCRREGSKSA